MTPAKLALVDGTIYTGRGFGTAGEKVGEVVFNTSMTGYQEVLTDPSYKGQIVAMTYPLIGNCGVNAEDAESARPQVEGFVVRELSREPSNFRSERSLEDYLRQHSIVGIEGIDTRALVRRIRLDGAMNGIISTIDLDDDSLLRKARAAPPMLGRDLVRQVVPDHAYEWRDAGRKAWNLLRGAMSEKREASSARRHVVALDFGMKRNIPHCLAEAGCRVTVVPGTASAEEVLRYRPDGVFLSNGPGDPAALGYAVDTIRRLVHKQPVFGICLGHQLLGQALGGRTFKLKFGHRGANQPVLNRRTNRVEITTQNHGFAVDPDSLPADVEVTHVNLNDQTVEGLRHRRLPVFSVQYHPEAAAGPHDSVYLFDEFVRIIDEARNR